jgi:SP family myo-inositol transporter-like MFS transporter 13
MPRNEKVGYNRFLLLVAGLGGLLYGVDVGIIASALPYLDATSKLNGNQLSNVVAAVLLGSVISTLFAGALADWIGRKPLMIVSGLLFVASIPIIALSRGYESLVLGRLLQGISAGLIGVVVPLYLAECLAAASRGKGTGIFQWLLTLGIVTAAVVGMYFSFRVEEVAKLGDPARLFAFKDTAWRSIFWVSLPPGILFVIGSFMVSESPRWLFRRGKTDAAYAALLRSRTDEQANIELAEMKQTAAAEKTKTGTQIPGTKIKESLLRRKYVIPFVLACLILACNQATGVNSIIGYNTNILLQAGLSDVQAHWGYVLFTIVNFLMTIGGVLLVDRKGRKFLLSVGSAGIIVSLICTGLLFRRTEKLRVDSRDAVQSIVNGEVNNEVNAEVSAEANGEANAKANANQKVTLLYDEKTANTLLAASGDAGKTIAIGNRPTSLVIIYSYGDFRAATKVARSDDTSATPIEITRASCVPANRVVAFFSNPFSNLEAARTAPLKIDDALITPVPSTDNGWLVAVSLFVFMAFFAIGPGVCVWLALSELMPTRIRSNGMSIALLINQAVSTTIAAVFLPTVGKHGYATMFFAFAGCTVIYFITAAVFLPETKGKTLEEIEAHFEGAAP